MYTPEVRKLRRQMATLMQKLYGKRILDALDVVFYLGKKLSKYNKDAKKDFIDRLTYFSMEASKESFLNAMIKLLTNGKVKIGIDETDVISLFPLPSLNVKYKEVITPEGSKFIKEVDDEQA